MHAASSNHFDLAETKAEAPLELGMKDMVGQGDNALGFPRLLGPHDRRAAAGERKNRERPGREEMLLGATAVIALMRHRGDDRGLTVGPAVNGNPRAFADRRMRAVGADQEHRRDCFAVSKLDIDAMG